MNRGYRSDATPETIANRFAAHGDWITGFVINGTRYGSDTYVPELDERALKFVERLKARPAPANILECGCLEGGHTLVLAHAFPQATIHAIDVRPESLAKAKLVTELTGTKNVTFQQDDLDDAATSLQRTYDAIFCVGLLYHLRDPREFLRRACAAAPVLWVWTVYCAESEVALTEGQSRGRLLHEETSHPLSAVRSESVLPTLGSLMDFVWEAGYTNVELVQRTMTRNNNGPAILFCASR